METKREKKTKEAAGSKTPHTKKKVNPYGVAAIAAAAGVLAIVVLTALAVNSFHENRRLKDELERQKQLAEDLEEHANKQKSELEKLQGEVEELLNIQEEEPVITTAQIEEQLASVRELVTKKYIYTNADRGEYNKTWLWGWDMPFSDKSLLVRYDGTIKAGIDLSAVQVDVDEGKRKITVTLPESKITDNNVPQDTVQVYETRDGLFNKVTIDDSNALISEGKKTMEEKAIERGLLAEADAEARALIKAFLALVPGMENYTLEVK